jgi:FtsP/CotA-like multicopper oxidase with cupredoxin domain
MAQLLALRLQVFSSVAIAVALTNTAAVLAQSPDPFSRIAANDNRAAAGTVTHGMLTVRLEAREGDWRPDADSDPGIVVRAFAVEGGPLQIPGPLIRVIEGTEVTVAISNRLVVPLIVHGLYSRLGMTARPNEVVAVPAGETREVRFAAGAPGVYFYWAASNTEPDLTRRAGQDTQLSGALIVDPKNDSASNDRVLVATSWTDNRLVDGQQVIVGRMVINGKSWPHTERLAYDVGDRVRLRLLNIGAAVHTMHLHGFYFVVESRGDERIDTMFPANSSPHMANTERLAPGRTFTLTWRPTRPGNWLFHCHDTIHIINRRQLDGRPVAPPVQNHVVNHALEMMAGPVMGITVRPSPIGTVTAAPAERRQLRLVARVDPAGNGTGAEPAYGFTLEEGGAVTPAAPPYLPGPTILLKRGEPVSITVENRLPEATGVHWHGIELESYYDGVPGFAGTPGQIAPAIMPTASFEARFTPPRAGTFIYHSHVDEVRQQQAGLSGALLVLDDPKSYDPIRDIVLLVTTPRRLADDDVVLLNGTATPPARELRAGERYRLRLINVHVSRPNLSIRMIRDDALQMWRALAKDGMDLPLDQATERPAEQQVGNGETYDFEFVPTIPGENIVQVRAAGGRLLASMPIHVR